MKGILFSEELFPLVVNGSKTQTRRVIQNCTSVRESALVAKMSRIAKITAKELSVHYILLSKLNRGNESRSDKKPLMSDLRESEAIEQDADIVCFIHRPGYYGIKVYNLETKVEETNYGELIIAKNRNGASGIVKFKHNESMTKFYDYESKQKEVFNASEFDHNPF